MEPSEGELEAYYQRTFAVTPPHRWYDEGIPAHGIPGNREGLWVLSDLLWRYLQPVHPVQTPPADDEAYAELLDSFLGDTGPVLAPRTLSGFGLNNRVGHHVVVLTGVSYSPAQLTIADPAVGGSRPMTFTAFRADFAQFPFLQWVGPRTMSPLGIGFPGSP